MNLAALNKMGSGEIGSQFASYWVRLSLPGLQLLCWQRQWEKGMTREISEVPATDVRGWLCGPGERRVGWGGAPVTGSRFGCCHCSSPSALSIFQGDRVPPTGS